MRAKIEHFDLCGLICVCESLQHREVYHLHKSGAESCTVVQLLKICTYVVKHHDVMLKNYFRKIAGHHNYLLLSRSVLSWKFVFKRCMCEFTIKWFL